jgi:hypothetical protein
VGCATVSAAPSPTELPAGQAAAHGCGHRPATTGGGRGNSRSWQVIPAQIRGRWTKFKAETCFAFPRQFRRRIAVRRAQTHGIPTVPDTTGSKERRRQFLKETPCMRRIPPSTMGYERFRQESAMGSSDQSNPRVESISATGTAHSRTTLNSAIAAPGKTHGLTK